MGVICAVLAVLITIFVLMIGDYNNVLLNIGIMYTDKALQVSFLALNLMIYAFGILAGVLFMLSTFFSARANYVKLKKQYEKQALGTDNAEDKVKLLENKIETLEAALKKALEK